MLQVCSTVSNSRKHYLYGTGQPNHTQAHDTKQPNQTQAHDIQRPNPTHSTDLHAWCRGEVNTEGTKSKPGGVPQLVAKEPVTLHAQHIQVDVSTWNWHSQRTSVSLSTHQNNNNIYNNNSFFFCASPFTKVVHPFCGR